MIFGYNNPGESVNSFNETTIQQFFDEFQMNYNGNLDFKFQILEKNYLVIIFSFQTTDKQKITKEIKLKLTTVDN